MVGRKALASLLVVVSVHPAWGSTDIVGTVGVSRAATLGRSTLLPGSTLFSGDAIEVAPRGNASIALAGRGTVYVAGDSKIVLSKAGNRVQFELIRGSAAFRFLANTLDARLADAAIRAGGSGPASGILTIRDPKSALLVAQEGELVLTTSHDANAVTLRAGEGLELSLVQDAAQSASPAPRKSAPIKWVLITGAVSAAIVTAVALFRNQNDKNLTFQDKRNEVSPFRFP